MHHRRSFLAGSLAFLAHAASRSCWAFSSQRDEVFSNASVGSGASGLLTQERFEGLVGTLFMVFLDEPGTVSYMHLRSVESDPVAVAKTSAAAVVGARRTPNKPAPTTESFSLVFSADRVLPRQDSYLVDHARLGRLALFLSPGLSKADGFAVTCSFNTIVRLQG